MEVWLEMIGTLGWPGAILFAIALVLYLVGRSIGGLLFHKDSGWVTLWFKGQLALMSEVRTAVAEMRAVAQEASRTLQEIQESNDRQNSRVNEALRMLLRISRLIGMKLEIPAVDELAQEGTDALTARRAQREPTITFPKEK